MRTIVFFASGLLIGALAVVSVAVSQSQDSRFVPMLGDDVVLHMMSLARATQVEARFVDMAASPDADLQVSVEDGRRVVDLAAVSATASWCDIAWQDGQAAVLKTAEPRSAKARAYVEALHTVAVDLFSADLRSAGPCPPSRKAHVAQYIAAQAR
jgi:hypothetical protein